jgi:hypothetical protein
MHWVAPSERDTGNAALEKRVWDAADQFRTNSGPKSQEYSAPGFGFIFLRFVSEGKSQPLVRTHSNAPQTSYTGGPCKELSIHGIAKTDEPGRLCRLNLATLPATASKAKSTAR